MPIEQPTYSPAPHPTNPDTTRAAGVVRTNVSQKTNYEEYEYIVRVDALTGLATFTTPSLFGKLQYIRILTDPGIVARVIIKNAFEEDEIIYNNNVKRREQTYVRTRTADQNARFLEMPCHIILNYPLICFITASKGREVSVKIALTKP